MRVLVSTLIVSPTAAHGGPVIAARQASALARLGIEVRTAAPVTEDAPESAAIERYSPASMRYGHFLDKRPDPQGLSALAGAIERFRPHVLYDVHGPLWAVDAAARSGVPVVSMVGDYGWFCRRIFLVDAWNRRCSGPESHAKCFACLNRTYSAKRRFANVALKHAASLGVRAPKRADWRFASFFLWEALQEAEGYVASMREKVDRFVVGDRQSRAFMLGHGIAEEKLHSIPQCLPEGALHVRRKPMGEDTPSTARPLKVAYVGRLQAEKGLHVLARAFDAVPDSVPIELWIIQSRLAWPGEIEPLFPDAARFRAWLARGRIKLFRPATSEELFELMASADVGVIPSLAYESPSLVLLEFVAQRTPIVRSESAGMDHVIQDGVNGRTFPYGDWQALKAALMEILARPALLDAWRGKLPQIGSDEHYARELADLFAQVIAARGSGAA